MAYQRCMKVCYLITELDPEFKTELVKLTNSIFSPENLRIKLLGGLPVTAEVLFGLIQTYVESFNKDNLPEPQTIYEVTYKRKMTNIYSTIEINCSISFYRSF